MLGASVNDRGFGIVEGVFSGSEVDTFFADFSRMPLRRTRAGSRHAMRNPAVATLARDLRLTSLAAEILGEPAIPYRATFFDKSPASNWLVVWHQDTALPVQKRFDAAGWASWSVKEGVIYGHAPARVLGRVVALRLHLDDSTIANGPLRILPGTHAMGVLEDDAIYRLAQDMPAVDCLVAKGGVVAMKPLAVHSSSKSHDAASRRVLHIEYAPSLQIDAGIELAIA
jgi:ectoine hydroxylase-related dioxygenase (phytanoyl-CoA dioxygenase family)